MTEPKRARGRAAPAAPAQPTTLEFSIPGPDEPGFIRRQLEAQQHLQAQRERPGVESMNALIEFLLTFVSKPADRDAARALLLDISRTEYRNLLNAILQENDAFLS